MPYIQEITLILNTISMLIVGISAYLLGKQIYSQDQWNRKKVAEETLTHFTSGKFTSCLDELKEQYNWKILTKNGETYDEVIKRLDSNDRNAVDQLLVNIFRNLETVGIKMYHGILDEDLSYDYLFSVLTNIVPKCKGFLAKVREERNEPCVYENAEHFANKWALKKKKKTSP